ncbi:MAG: sialidase [Ahniella sp.]|nr:sialidase [Ahniella sp.]
MQSIGAITVDPTQRKIVWVGTGESWTRNSVSIGNGVYRSADGGETWQHMGLSESERITRILIHPADSNTVYVCAPGKLWSDSAERGLFKTSDGGQTWSQVLKGPNLSTGCGALSMDPKDPNVLFASLWDFRRQGWTFRSGGEGPTAKSGSGLFRTADGGATWTEVGLGAKGFGPKPFGRIEVEIAPSNPDIVYAVVESTRSALFRSSDGGTTWEERDRSQSMVWRPFYFSNLVVDPKNAERVFKMNLNLIVSDDGGKSFTGAGGSAHGDWHDLWIDPDNTQTILGGDDAGLWLSMNGGTLWHKNHNLPISQFYHVSVDDQSPYQVYGGLQDNTSWIGDSQYPGGISNSRWEALPGGDGFWVFSDPADPNYVYFESQGGALVRIHRKTLQQRDIQPKSDRAGEKLRFNWNAPLHLSPNEKGTLYIGAQFLFRTRDQGQTWERISPDLTTNDPAKQKQEQSGGITVDNSAAEQHTTIYSISESPVRPSMIWVGTDDGNVQLTVDGGDTWRNTAGAIKDVPKASWVSWVEASPHDADVAFVTLDRHTFGDMEPHAYMTRDAGKSWARIASKAQGVRGYAHVIKQDPVNANVLYLGTELGLFVSIDQGRHWAEFKGDNFPAVAVRDLVIHPRDHDLVVATHGRGIWIIDDLTPVRSLGPDVLGSEVAFVPGRAEIQQIQAFGGWPVGDAMFFGENPSGDIVINYFQKSRHLFGKLKLEVFDAEGKLVDTLPASKRRGMNRVSWAMRGKPPRVPMGATISFAATQGLRHLPGDYTLRMTKNGQVYERKIHIGMDPKATYSLEDRKAQHAAATEVQRLFERMSSLNDRIVGLRDQARSKAAGLPEADRQRKALLALGESADALRKKIVATTEGGAITGEERLREHTDALYAAIVFWEAVQGLTI